MNKRGTAFLGIILIAAGAILLMNVLGFIPGSPLDSLAEYWPFILIISGILYLTNQRILGTLALVLAIMIVINHGAGQIIPSTGEERTFTQTVPNTFDAEEVNITINYGAGDIKLTQGEENNFFTNKITTNHKEDPILSSEIEDNNVFIEVNQPNLGWNWNLKTKWDITLQPETNYNLDFNYGAIDAYMNFTGLEIDSLEIDSGASSLVLSLEEHPTKVKIINGASDMKLYVPENIGTIITIEGGALDIETPKNYDKEENTYTNNLYEEDEENIEISINSGASKITIYETT